MNGKSALVTGASLGLGRALVEELVLGGWDVIADARDATRLQRAMRALHGPGTVTAIAGDVSDAAHRAELVRAVDARGRLDVLVNNASVLGPSPRPELATYPIGALEDVYAVNVLAPLALFQLVRTRLEELGGVVVNVTSDAAVEPYPGWGGYGSSKAALDQLTAVLAEEHPGLRIYSFDPGDMATELHQQAYPGEDISDRPQPERVVPALLRLIAGDIPSGRYRAAELTGPVAA